MAIYPMGRSIAPGNRGSKENSSPETLRTSDAKRPRPRPRTGGSPPDFVGIVQVRNAASSSQPELDPCSIVLEITALAFPTLS